MEVIKNKIKEWVFKNVLKNNMKFEILKSVSNINAKINMERCTYALKYLKLMVKEIGAGLEDKVHLYIVDVEESGKGQLYVIDDINKNHICKFDSHFNLELFRILCEDNKYRIVDNSYFLNLKSTEAIELFMSKLIKDVKENQYEDISSCQYYQFSKVKIGCVEGTSSFVRFYGIGYEEEIKGGVESNTYKIFDSMLNECIGYIESPTDRNVINTFKVREEYASQILKKNNIVEDSELITEIASTRYEGAECTGSILFCTDSNIEPLIQFKKIEFKVGNIRAIRKYLEMAQNEYCLWAKKEEKEYYIYGMDKRNEKYNYTLLQFTGYRKWLIKDSKNNVLLERKREKYSVPDIKGEDYQEIRNSLKFLLNGNCGELESGDEDIEHLVNIVQTAKRQQHGTMIVFVHSDEVDKLTDYFCEKNRGIKLIRKVDLTDKYVHLLLNLTSIDGALIIDTKGLCHAIGVILDGIANEKCNMARGARYNSALTFITNKDFESIYGFKREKCKVFVFSEDKTINILPEMIDNK